MSDNQIDWFGVINLAVKGASGVKEELDKVRDAADKFAESGDLTEKQNESLAKSMNRLEKASNSGAASADKLGQAEARLAQSRDRLKDATLGTSEDRLAQTRERLNRATEAQAKAEAAYNSARNSGNVSEQVSAANQLSSANHALASATTTAAQAQAKLTSQGPAMRYALYDVSTSAAVAGAALTALALAPGAVAIRMDRAFADVQRTTETTGTAATRLRNDFNELHKSIPVSWGALTDIGRIAGQMNIAADSLAEFTSLVAKFSATADVTVEKSATAFGRLAQLLKVPANEMSNLGSSILNVGVNSVATDDQIINVSTNIAAMGAYAKMSAADVFGFSAALASLGTQPELARGTVTRLFGQIEVAIGNGGDKLQTFANLAGVTAEEFKSKWGTAGGSTEVIQGLLEGLNRASESGESMFGVLKSIGITASRDIPTLARLAQNTDLVAQALTDARKGYEDNTALNEQYSVISSTVAEKLKLLGQNFEQLVSSVGAASGVLGGLIDVGIGVIQMLDNLVNNPIGATILGVVGVVTALGGALALLGAVITRVAGGYVGFASVITRAQSAIRAKTAATQADTAANVANAASTAAATREVAGAVVATNGFKLALKGLLLSTGVGAALVALGAVVEALGASMESTEDKAERLLGSSSGLREAIAQDTKIWSESGEAISTHSVALENHATAVDESVSASRELLGVQSEVVTGSDAGTQAIDTQTAALGENSEAWLRKALAESDTIQGLVKNPELLKLLQDSGLDMNKAIAEGLKGDGSLETYLDTIRSKVEEGRSSLNLFSAEGLAGVDRLRDAGSFLDNLGTMIDGSVSSALNAGEAFKLMGLGAEDAADSSEDLSSAIKELQSTLFDGVNEALSMSSSLYSLGQSLAENAGMFDLFSEGGRANMEALMKVMDNVVQQSGGDAAVTAANMQALYDNLVQGGKAPAQMLAFLSESIATLRASSGGKVVAPTMSFAAPSLDLGYSKKMADLSQKQAKASGQAQKAAEKEAKAREKANKAADKAAQDAIKNVRTLTDYANDLSGIWSRAFDIRFSGQSSEDKISSMLQSMKKDAEDAADKIKDLQQTIRSLQADIGGLQSDLSLQQYFYKIAVDYGDTARAAVIQANMAKIESDLAGKRNDLDKATKDLESTLASQSKTLEGNSEAAIKNRAQILDLVKSYQDQIKALADSGAGADELARKTEQLRQQFITQATQLGYSQSELGKYAASFDDVRLAIDRVPRNVTVTANVNPAIQAFNEYAARAAASAASARDSMNSALSSVRAPNFSGMDGAYGSGARAGADWRNAFQAEMRRNPVAIQGYLIQGQQVYRVPGTDLKMYSEGGYTGSGGKYEPKGVVHGGEYVFRKDQVDQSTGLPYASAMASMMPRSYTPNYQTVNNMSSGTGIMEIGPNSIHALARAVSTVLMLDGKQVAASTTAQYAVQGRNGAY